MNTRITGACLTMMLAVFAVSPACAKVTETTTAEAQVAEAAAASFVPADFAVPTMVETADFTLVPLGPDVVDLDFEAYMSSIAHLQQTFTRSTGWPREDISADDAMQDMENEQARFASRTSFAYAVLTPDGSRERGSLYVAPSRVDGYDAVVRMWVTQADHDAGFDAELYAWAIAWIAAKWPFANVAYPGRAIEWGDWDRMTAENTAD